MAACSKPRYPLAGQNPSMPVRALRLALADRLLPVPGTSESINARQGIKTRRVRSCRHGRGLSQNPSMPVRALRPIKSQ